MFPTFGPPPPFGSPPPFGAALPFGPPFEPLPFGMMPPQGNAYGKTRYRYVTEDGGPPLMGAVPTKSPFDPPNLFSNCAGGFHPFGPPPPPGMGPLTGTPPPPWAMPRPPQFCPPPPAPAPAVATPHWKIPPPPPPNSHSFGATNEEPEEPIEGNRVKGQLATFPDKNSGYIFPKRNVTIHLFADNVIEKHPSKNNILYIGDEKFNVQHAPCDMTFRELIEQIGCASRANKHPPYNVPGQEYPEQLLGIQELLEYGGRGHYILGSKIMLTDTKALHKLGDIWPEFTCTAGQAKPRWVVRIPV